MHGEADSRREGKEGPLVHHVPAMVALVNDHLVPHSGQISL